MLSRGVSSCEASVTRTGSNVTASVAVGAAARRAGGGGGECGRKSRSGSWRLDGGEVARGLLRTRGRRHLDAVAEPHIYQCHSSVSWSASAGSVSGGPDS